MSMSGHLFLHVLNPWPVPKAVVLWARCDYVCCLCVRELDNTYWINLTVYFDIWFRHACFSHFLWNASFSATRLTVSRVLPASTIFYKGVGLRWNLLVCSFTSLIFYSIQVWKLFFSQPVGCCNRGRCRIPQDAVQSRHHRRSFSCCPYYRLRSVP